MVKEEEHQRKVQEEKYRKTLIFIPFVLGFLLFGGVGWWFVFFFLPLQKQVFENQEFLSFSLR